MAELILEPYAVSQHWSLPQADSKWEALLCEYLESLARRCNEAGLCVIGHIKALALFPDGGYVQVSVVSPRLRANVKGSVPTNCTELELALNVIVYGLERALIEQITRETAAHLANQWKGEVITKATDVGSLSPTGPHATHTHHERE
jgi:hypothetical protein